MFDPADGLIYVGGFYGGWNGTIEIVRPPCDVVRTIYLSNLTWPYVSFPYGMAYDPVTREVVVTDAEPAPTFAYILQGTALVKTVTLGGPSGCPDFESWDAALQTVLIADPCAGPPYQGGVDELYLSIVNGVTRTKVVLDAFDTGNEPTAVLVADRYIFTAGNTVNVYNDSTLAFLGSFAVTSSDWNTLAWDPLNDTVVLGRYAGSVSYHSVVFLNADSVRTRTFTLHRWIYHDILDGGVGGVAYSPYMKELYFAAWLGNDVWELGKNGTLVHVYLAPGFDGGPQGLTYDSVNHDLYVCGSGTSVIYALA